MITTLLLLATTYANPVLHMDFSDPDACVGKDGKVYMTASSFGGLPGLPVLASDDLVNWSYVGYALQEHPGVRGGADDTDLTVLPASARAGDPEHGNRVWAPSIRYRADRDEYVIYWGDPDRGAYRVSARSPEGPWGEPRLVVPAKGMIDVCPLYDDDGRIYLVNAWAASRAGLNSVLTVRELDADEMRPVTEPVMVYDGIPEGNFTTEGPKFYKKDGEYWLWFPAGGVEQGWQVAARAKSPYGPYETKTVLAQGKTGINGPHQGGVVKTGDFWHFLHFSDRGAYGRIVYLEPMEWAKGSWPVVGINGEPVGAATSSSLQRQKPFGGLAVSDEFDAPSLGLQWQFLGRSAEQAVWPTSYGYLRLYSTAIRPWQTGARNLWKTPNLMVQKFPAEAFTATLKARVSAKQDAEESGLIVQGRSYARLGLRFSERRQLFEVVYTECRDADLGKDEDEPRVLGTLPPRITPAGLRAVASADIYLRLSVARGTDEKGEIVPNCTFSWSTDGTGWQSCPVTFPAASGKWIGATFGLYSVHGPEVKDRGWLDADWLRVE